MFLISKVPESALRVKKLWGKTAIQALIQGWTSHLTRKISGESNVMSREALARMVAKFTGLLNLQVVWTLCMVSSVLLKRAAGVVRVGGVGGLWAQLTWSCRGVAGG